MLIDQSVYAKTSKAIGYEKNQVIKCLFKTDRKENLEAELTRWRGVVWVIEYIGEGIFLSLFASAVESTE